MALPLLPAEMILAAFERLMCVEFPELSERDRHNIFEFKKYMRKTWIDQFTPEILTVFGKGNATNNGAESFHRMFKDSVQTHHPNPWVFMVKLNNTLTDKSDEYERLLIHGESEAYR